LDLVVNNENQKSFVYKNNSREQNKNSYIGLLLRGKGNNTYAIGSKIKVYKGKDIYYREVVPGRGFQSSVDYKQIIGLGKLTGVDSMQITWPDRTTTTYQQPELNKVHRLQQPAQSNKPADIAEPATNTLLQQQSIVLDKHTEDDYIDFYYERNVPELLSREGPKIARGDVNGDGLEDMYIGGAKGQAGQLYVQTATGFIKKEEPVFKIYADFEDAAVLLFDADKDGDLDLYIGAGGNNMEKGTREAQHRLYKNDGKGNYTIDVKAFMNNDMNISVAVNYDYDGDGDEDIYIGSRSVPYSYGVTPQSYLYKNDGNGHFTDVTNELNKELSTAGMITGAVWADVTGDNQKELIITGEWMSTRIYSYNKKTNKLEEQTNTNLNNLYGWWQTIAAADINGDGRTDLIIGNIGENFYLRPDKDNPVKLWLNDFDQSGTMDQFLTRTIDKRDMPVFLKREITEQFPALKKGNLKHSEYAKKSIQDLFSKELISQSRTKTFNYCQSIVAINDGNGKFRIEPLPQQIQLSSVNAIAITDLNNDNRPDMLLGGNLYNFPPQFGRLDASYGHVLLNESSNNKLRLNYIEARQSGLTIRGEVKDIKVIDKYIIAAINNDKPVVYQLKK
jgi:hypothetical protein